jgi:hypothetical protein
MRARRTDTHVRRASLDWSRRVPFARAAPELLQCLGLSRALFEEMRATGGDRGLADLLVAGRGSPVAAPGPVRPLAGSPYDPWEWAVDVLPPAERARVVDVLRRDLASAGSSTEALTRALWRVDPVDGTDLVARARELTTRSERGPLPVVLARLAEARHAEAGALACAALPGSVRESWISAADAVALAVIAATKAPCPGVAALLSARPDQLEYDCRANGGAHLCTEPELAPLAQDHVRGVARDRWFHAGHPELDGWRALLAAGYAQRAPLIRARSRSTWSAQRTRGMPESGRASH